MSSSLPDSPAPVLVSQGRDVSLGPFRERPQAATEGMMEAERSFYADADSGVQLGLWEGTRGEFEAVRNGYTELFHILAGRATLHTQGQPSVDLQAGDTVATPSGWKGRWEIHETVRKLYVVIYDRS